MTPDQFATSKLAAMECGCDTNNTCAHGMHMQQRYIYAPMQEKDDRL